MKTGKKRSVLTFYWKSTIEWINHVTLTINSRLHDPYSKKYFTYIYSWSYIDKEIYKKQDNEIFYYYLKISNRPSVISIRLENYYDKSYLNTQDENGQTLLIKAIINNNNEEAKRLINKGANINICDNKHNTALYYARLNKNVELIELLSQHGGYEYVTK